MKIDHITHLEDLIYSLETDLSRPLYVLRHLDQFDITVKWDGSPSLFAGTDPEDGKFFVATKSIFNKVPVVYKTHTEIDARCNQTLASKLHVSLQYLPNLKIKGIIQGDFLFEKSDLFSFCFNETVYTAFHPNTIIYAMTNKHEAFDLAKMGVSFHTSYVGPSLKSLTAVPYKQLTSYVPETGVMLFSNTLDKQEQYHISETQTDRIKKISLSISSEVLSELRANPEWIKLFKQHYNFCVKNTLPVHDNVSRRISHLRMWVIDKYDKEAEKRKTVAGKKVQWQKRIDFITFISKYYLDVYSFLSLHESLIVEKKKLINTLNNRKSNLKTFVKTKYGTYKPTSHEGFVLTDKTGSEAIKLVDRMEFSYNNFSPDILKGWDHQRD